MKKLITLQVLNSTTRTYKSELKVSQSGNLVIHSGNAMIITTNPGKHSSWPIQIQFGYWADNDPSSTGHNKYPIKTRKKRINKKSRTTNANNNWTTASKAHQLVNDGFFLLPLLHTVHGIIILINKYKLLLFLIWRQSEIFKFKFKVWSCSNHTTRKHLTSSLARALLTWLTWMWWWGEKCVYLCWQRIRYSTQPIHSFHCFSFPFLIHLFLIIYCW